MKSLNIAKVLITLLAAFALQFAENVNASIFTVGGRSGPWMYVNGGLNTTFQYGLNDQLAPTLVTGLSFGQQVTLTYQSGTVTGGGAFVQAQGDLGIPNPNAGPHFNGDTPAVYVANPNSTFAWQLLGAFADNSGQIVGTPLAIGNGPITFAVPSGASRLQLGVADNAFGDNSGSWSINVVISNVPEPGVGVVLAMGMFGFVFRKVVKKH